jgi:hypothetical protein
MYSFNIVCTTIGRDSLSRLIDSFKDQLTENDWFTIISDLKHNEVEKCLEKYDFKFNLNYIKNKWDYPRYAAYGHPLLNIHMNNLEGDFIMFADDDDYYAADAFESIRKAVTKRKLYIFKHQWGDTINWAEPVVELGNIGKCMGVIPNTHMLPYFENNVHGDGNFYIKLIENMDYEFVDKVIYKVRDTP